MGINNIKIKLDKGASVPEKAYTSDAGFDVKAISVEYDKNTDSFIYGTGIHLEMPEDYVCLSFPRSSNFKTDFYLANGIGVIDNGYRGEIKFIYKCRTAARVIIKINSIISKLLLGKTTKLHTAFQPYDIGDRIGQLLFTKLPIVHFVETNELSESDRGNNGHGSTGK